MWANGDISKLGGGSNKNSHEDLKDNDSDKSK
jgi:hypothetical protein